MPQEREGGDGASGGRWGLIGLYRIAGGYARGLPAYHLLLLKGYLYVISDCLLKYGRRLQNLRMALAAESQSLHPHLVDSMTRGLTRDAVKRSGMSVYKVGKS